MIKRLGHINIGSNNLAESEHFYCDVLGLTKTFEFFKDDQLYGFYLAAGETTFIEVFIQNQITPEAHPLINHLCLEVEDIDAAVASVRSRGWQITDKKFGCDHSWQAWITDPSGVRIELMQYTSASSQFTGSPCAVDW